METDSYASLSPFERFVRETDEVFSRTFPGSTQSQTLNTWILHDLDDDQYFHGAAFYYDTDGNGYPSSSGNDKLNYSASSPESTEVLPSLMNSDAPDIFVQPEYYHLTPPPELPDNPGQNIHGSAYSDVAQDCATPVISPPVRYISDDRESPYRVTCEQVDNEYEAVENGSPAVAHGTYEIYEPFALSPISTEPTYVEPIPSNLVVPSQRSFGDLINQMYPGSPIRMHRPYEPSETSCTSSHTYPTSPLSPADSYTPYASGSNVRQDQDVLPRDWYSSPVQEEAEYPMASWASSVSVSPTIHAPAPIRAVIKSETELSQSQDASGSAEIYNSLNTRRRRPHACSSESHLHLQSQKHPPSRWTSRYSTSPRLTMRLSPLPGKRAPDKKPSLACLFCRGRKIACGPPPPESSDRTCTQCQRRQLQCNYPAESHRGIRKKKTPLSKPGPKVMLKAAPPKN